MSKPVIALTVLAGVTAASSALAAFPAASAAINPVLGGIAVIASASAVYAGWHTVGHHHNPRYKLVGGSLAVLFAVGLGISTYHSNMVGEWRAVADKEEATTTAVAERVEAATTAATDAATRADALYQQQEQARMSALAAVTAELRATSKNKYPDQYDILQQQVDKLSVPTQRQPTASQGVATGTAVLPPAQQQERGINGYQAGIAALFEILTPALLILSGFFRRGDENHSSGVAVVGVADAVVSTTTPVVEAVAAVVSATTPAVEPVAEEASPTAGAVDPLEALEAWEVPPNTEGNITRQLVMGATGCTETQARKALDAAVGMGILTKTGTGGATRYRYAKPQLRSVK